MAEFKKLSAVEAVNTVSDTASVLIEEDGVIKRAPKRVISNNEELDLDIDIVGEAYSEEQLSHTINFVNTFENIKNKLLKGIKPKCRAKVLATAWAGDPLIKAVEVFDSLQVYYQPEDNVAEISERIIFLGVGAHVSPKIILLPDDDLVVFWAE